MLTIEAYLDDSIFFFFEMAVNFFIKDLGISKTLSAPFWRIFLALVI